MKFSTKLELAAYLYEESKVDNMSQKEQLGLATLALIRADKLWEENKSEGCNGESVTGP